MVKFITEIAHALFSYKSYPTREEKDHVARQCVKKFPFLEATCGTGYVSSIEACTQFMDEGLRCDVTCMYLLYICMALPMAITCMQYLSHI